MNDLKKEFNEISALEFQRETFHKTTALTHDIQSIAGYIQNNFNDFPMKNFDANKFFSEMNNDMNSSFDMLISKLNTLRNDYRNIIKFYSDNLTT